MSWQEDYPAALDHLTAAYRIAETMPANQKAYYLSVEARLWAEVLCRLGHIEEAKHILAAIPKSAWETGGQPNLDYLRLQTEFLMNQGRYWEAVLTAEKGLTKVRDFRENWDLQAAVAEGLGPTGEASKALALCDELLQRASDQSPVLVAEAKLAKSRALLELQQWGPARALAEEAGQLFAASKLQESELASLWLIAKSYQGVGAFVDAEAANRRIQDLLSKFKHSYGDDGYRLFVKRSKIAEIVADRTSRKSVVMWVHQMERKGDLMIRKTILFLGGVVTVLAALVGIDQLSDGPQWLERIALRIRFIAPDSSAIRIVGGSIDVFLPKGHGWSTGSTTKFITQNADATTSKLVNFSDQPRGKPVPKTYSSNNGTVPEIVNDDLDRQARGVKISGTGTTTMDGIVTFELEKNDDEFNSIQSNSAHYHNKHCAKRECEQVNGVVVTIGAFEQPWFCVEENKKCHINIGS